MILCVLARPRHRRLPATVRQDLIAQKDRETRAEAAARLGVSRTTVRRLRGTGGKAPLPPSALRTWLLAHLPAHQPAGTHDLDWAFASRYVEGVPLAVIAGEAGVNR